MLARGVVATVAGLLLALPASGAEPTEPGPPQMGRGSFAEGVKEVVQDVKDGGKQLGQAAKDTGKKIGHAARDTARDIGHASRDAVKEAGQAAKEVVTPAAEKAPDASSESEKTSREKAP